MHILALDLGTLTGWAHSAGYSGTWDLSVKRDESRDMRLIRFRSKLQQTFSGIAVDLIVFEAARNAAPGMQGSLVVQAELQAVLKVWADDEDIDYRGYSAKEIKKHATGKGNASKLAMLDAAQRKWPERRIETADEADALWLLDLAMTEYAG